MSIQVSYKLKYAECGLAPKFAECNPRLCMYYDTHVHRTEAGGGIVMIPLDEDHLEKEYSGTLKATAFTGIAIPETACIGFACYAQRPNEAQNLCYINAGTAHIRLGDIAASFSRGQSYKVERPLLLQTTKLLGDVLEKGKLAIEITSFQMDGSARMVPMNQCILGASISQIDSMLNAFINRRVDHERRIKDTWPGISNVRAPMDISSAGIELTESSFIPIEGFAMAEPIEMNAAYLQNAYERVMVRRGLNPKHDFDSLERPYKAEVMAEVCCFAGQMYDYIPDQANANKRGKDNRVYHPEWVTGFEDMNNAATSEAGDCEDTTDTNKNGFAGLKSTVPIDANAHPQLMELREIASHYTFFMTLATVHGAKADDQTEQIGAHMYGLLLPAHQIRAALKTNSIGDQVLAHLPIASSESSAGLPTLICEGTGRIRPMGPGPMLTVKETLRSAVIEGAITKDHPVSYDPLIVERMLISRKIRSKNGMKTELPHDYGAPSNFYLGNLLLVTNEFIDKGYNVGAIICGQINRDSNQITRGATFVDIVNQHDDFALIPCEPIPQPIMNVMHESVALRAPPRPYVLDRSKPMSGVERHPLLEKLKSRVQGFKRTGTAPFGPVDVFMRDHQFNEALLKRMGDELSQIASVYKVDYELEHITNSMHTYRVSIFLDHEKARASVKSR